MNIKSAKELLITDFSNGEKRTIANSVTKGYSYAKNLFENNDIFSCPSSENILPHLINLGVEFEIFRNIKIGNLNFDYRFVYNSAKNHQHLEIKTGNSIATISQVNDRNELPRKAKFRNNHRLNNRLSLFDPKVIKLNNDNDQFYSLITHGRNNFHPLFINLGVPSPYKGWIFKENLFIYTSSENETEEESEELLVSFKEHIKEVKKGEAK